MWHSICRLAVEVDARQNLNVLPAIVFRLFPFSSGLCVFMFDTMARKVLPFWLCNDSDELFSLSFLCYRLFLLGLDKYGKGDWRSISRNFVVTRTPTQVASHAQKYFIRLNSMNKDRRRSSIHDITSVGNADVSTPQGPITGQNNSNNNNNNSSVAVTGGGNKSAKQAVSQPPPGPPMYGTPTIGQPVGGPLVSAVGTPVNLPAPPHMAYGVHAAPVPGSVVPGASMNMGQMPYTMPRTPTAHR